MANTELDTKGGFVNRQIPILGYDPRGRRIREGDQLIVRRAMQWRVHFGTEGIDPHAYTDAVHVRLPVYHPITRDGMLDPKITANGAKEVLHRLKDRDLSSVTVGIEEEGNLYKDGTLISRYGPHFKIEDDLHPEATDSIWEVATGTTPDGKYPATATEIAHTVADALEGGIKFSEKLGADYVLASTPEGGDASQLRWSPHPYNQRMHPPEQRRSKKDVPDEVFDVFNKIHADFETVPLTINATHVHTLIPLELQDNLVDPRTAYALGISRLTLASKLVTLGLYNTQDFAGQRFSDLADVRAIIRRADPEAHDATIPDNAYDFFEESIRSVESGTIHSFSRYPYRGQRERMRIKEIFTCEKTDPPANTDQRLVLTEAYFNQLLNAEVLKGLEETGGDETKIIPYLTIKYGHVFNTIDTLHSPTSSLNVDRAFNRDRFDGKVNSESFKQQIDTLRDMSRNIGKEVPGLKTQAIVVDFMLGKATSNPGENVSLAQYLGTDKDEYRPNGLNTGIITDYKGRLPIDDNLKVQADALQKQTATLKAVRDDSDLFDFFGIPKAQRTLS